MSVFTLKINTDNAAFTDGDASSEVHRILRGLLESGKLHDGLSGSLRDLNGNTVGEWKFS